MLNFIIVHINPPIYSAVERIFLSHLSQITEFQTKNIFYKMLLLFVCLSVCYIDFTDLSGKSCENLEKAGNSMIENNWPPCTTSMQSFIFLPFICP